MVSVRYIREIEGRVIQGQACPHPYNISLGSVTAEPGL